MKNISITKYLERDVWEKKLEQINCRIKFDSGSDQLTAYALIETPHILIGVNYEESSIYPKVKKLRNVDKYFVGADNRLVIVESKSEEICSQIDLQSYFVDVIEVVDKGLIIIEEIGVGFYKYFGERVWFTPTELIENYYVEKDTIIVTTDSGKIKLSTSTGKTI